MKFIKIENLESDSKIKVLTLNRPEVKNAFHPEMISEITAFFRQEHQQNSSRLIIMKGEGDVFCAGADLNWMKDMVNFSIEENLVDSGKLWDMFESVLHCQVPVVALAQGAVMGGGLGLLVAADYVLAEEKTVFCFSEVKLGMAPAIISGFITRKIADAFCRPLMISGETFDTGAAQKIGLIYQTYSGQVDLNNIAKIFSANGIEAMKETKKLLNSLLDTQINEARKNLCARVISERRVSLEGQERLKRFLNK